MTNTTSTRGTLRWMAPELLQVQATDLNAGRSTVASDMYSMAMVLYEARRLESTNHMRGIDSRYHRYLPV
jgi:serine/threonine protein kinase